MPHVRLTWTNDSYIVNLGNRFNTNIRENLPPHSYAQGPQINGTFTVPSRAGVNDYTKQTVIF